MIKFDSKYDFIIPYWRLHGRGGANLEINRGPELSRVENGCLIVGFEDYYLEINNPENLKNACNMSKSCI